MNIGVVTSGGDCAGLNAVIRGIVRRGIVAYGDRVIGFLEGWRGAVENRTMELTIENTRGLLNSGGTVLKSSRVNPYKEEGGVARVKQSIEANGIDVMVVAGGDGSMRLCNALEGEGIPTIGLPKTIDNDLPLTDYSFGFDTALNVVVEALGRLASTAESHDRVMVCEVMGNACGALAFYGGLAGGADYILLPEIEPDLDDVCRVVLARHDRGRDFSIVVVAEGTRFPDGTPDLPPGPYGPGRAGQAVAEFIAARTGYETRNTVLGHVQRGGSPTAFDRVLATRLGTSAADAAHKGLHGVMLALQGTKIVPVSLVEVAGSQPRSVLPEHYERVKVFFG